MSELKQKQIDRILSDMEKISPRVKELVAPIKLLPKKFQEDALARLYSRTQEWKRDTLDEQGETKE